MKIIPVIDLKDGIVVAAQQGKRNSYQAIESTLSDSYTIEKIIDGFLSVHAFNILYIADLNAITNTGDNQKIIDSVIKQYCNIEFWIDNGKKVDQILKTANLKYKAILGSENQTSINQNQVNSLAGNYILSLDFFPDIGYTGPKNLLTDPTLWPENIIIMSLDHVGAHSGPDIKRLNNFSKKNTDKNFIAAGGVRNENDLLTLKEIGINHALVASALHSGEINAKTIKSLFL